MRNLWNLRESCRLRHFEFESRAQRVNKEMFQRAIVVVGDNRQRIALKLEPWAHSIQQVVIPLPRVYLVGYVGFTFVGQQHGCDYCLADIKYIRPILKEGVDRPRPRVLQVSLEGLEFLA